MTKQSEILKHLSKGPTTLENLVKNIPLGFYNNHNLHMEQELGKLIKKGLVNKKDGFYALVSNNNEQQKLF